MQSHLLNTKKAAEYLGVKPGFLEKDRHYGAKIPFVRLGARTIRYRQEDLEQFVASNAMRSTSEYQQGAASAA